MALNQINFEFGQEFPSSWDFGKDVLDGFEQFMDTTPNLDPAVSYGAQRFPTLAPSRQSSDDASEEHAEHAEQSSKGRASDRKQQNNRAAQKRFRQRQKVRSCDLLISDHTSVPVYYQSALSARKAALGLLPGSFAACSGRNVTTHPHFIKF